MTNSFPKMAPLPGSIHLEWRRCGKPTCRCATGSLHGPYYVRRWWSGGRQRKTYVAAERVGEALVATAMWRALLPAETEIRRIVR